MDSEQASIETASVAPPAPFDLAPPPVSAGAQLVSVLFGRGWRRARGGARVAREIRGYRVIGVAAGELSGARIDGVLVRHARQKSYRLVTDDAIHDLDAAAAEAFLKRVRHGHHGGAGRAQGPFARDSDAYTTCMSVTLTNDAIETGVKRGDGVLSLGIRELARLVAQRERKHPGSIPPAGELAQRSGEDKAVFVKVRVYLDRESSDRLAALGGGNLSRGIRFAAWLATHRIRQAD